MSWELYGLVIIVGKDSIVGSKCIDLLIVGFVVVEEVMLLCCILSIVNQGKGQRTTYSFSCEVVGRQKNI